LDEERPADKYRLSKSFTDIKAQLALRWGTCSAYWEVDILPICSSATQNNSFKIKMFFSLVTPQDFIMKGQEWYTHQTKHYRKPGEKEL